MIRRSILHKSTRYFAAFLSLVVLSLLAATSCAAKPAATDVAGIVSVELVAADKTKIAANYYPASQPKAILLLFHQAGADYHEYDLIGPRLAAAGYSALAVNQRGGGAPSKFKQAKPDMEAALAWAQGKKSGAQGKNLPVILWGSSYSAAWVYVLAAENPSRIAAAMTFSGGDYLGGSLVRDAARKVTVPIFATSAPGEVSEMRAILELVQSTDKTFHVPGLGGVHGSSTLLAKANPRGAEENWAAVMAFLARVAP